MIKVSIIVPVYNAEEYIEKNIKYLTQQTLKDIEIIIVNDGSNDRSLDICKKYSQIDNRIIVLDQKNSGTSVARNNGIKIARGEYIGFVDIDDWIEPNMYESMYNKAKHYKSNTIMCNYVVDKNQIQTKTLIPIEDDIISRESIVNNIIPNMLASKDLDSNAHTIMGSAWRLLVNNKFIKEHKIEFPVGIPIMEDLIFCIGIFVTSHHICLDKGCYYHYKINNNSSVRKYREDFHSIQLQVYKNIEKILIDQDIYTDEIKHRMNIRYINMFITSMINEVNTLSKKTEYEKIKNIKCLCEDKKLSSILKTIDIKSYTLRKRLLLKAIKSKNNIYIYIYFTIVIRIITKLK